MEQALLRKLYYVEDDIEAWEKWHCKRELCEHHMCRVRKEKLAYLIHLRNELYLRWRSVRKGNRDLSV